MAPAATSASFTLGAPAAVTVTLTPAVPGSAVPLALLSASLPSGPQSLNFSLAAVPEGRYTLDVTATPAGGTAVPRSVPVTVDRSLTGFALAPAVISPNGDGVADSAAFNFTLSRPLSVQLRLEQAGVVVGTVFSGPLGPGVQSVAWDGTIN